MIPAQQLPAPETRPPAAQLQVVEAMRENALVIPPHLERIIMDPEAQPQDVNGAIVAGFGRFGAFLQNFQAQSQEEAQRVAGQIRALVREQHALQKRLDLEEPNNAALKESLRKVNERLKALLEANPAPRAGELERRVNQLETADLRRRIDALERPAAPVANQPDPIAELGRRIAALERPAPPVANQPDPLVELRRRLDGLEVRAPNPVAANPAQAQPIPEQILARIQHIETRDERRIREEEKERREAEISQIRQRLLLNIATSERAVVAAGLLFTPSVTTNVFSGGVTIGKIVGALNNPVLPLPSVVSVFTFLGSTAASITTGIMLSNRATRLERNQDFLNLFDGNIKNRLSPREALRIAQDDINVKYSE